MQNVIQPRYLFKGRTTAGQGDAVSDLGYLPTFQAQASVTSGPVSFSVRVWVRDIPKGQWQQLMDLTKSGNGQATESGWTKTRWTEYMGELLSVSGTNATVDLVLAS